MSALVNIRQRIEALDELLAGLNRRAVEDHRAALALQIRGLEKEYKALQAEFQSVAKRQALDVCRYIIPDTETPTIRGLTTVLHEFQDLFSTIYSLRLTGEVPVQSPRKKRAKKKTDETREPLLVEGPRLPEFAFGYSFHSSTGIAMTLPANQGLFPDALLLRTIETISDLAKTRNAEDVSRFARQVGPPAIEAMYKWANSHAQFGYGVGIEWQHIDGAEQKIRLQREELERLRHDLSQTTIEERLEVTGTLIRVDSRNREFIIVKDVGGDVEGTFDTAITEEHAASVPSRYTAVLLERTRIIPPAGEEEVEPEYFLTELRRPE